MSSFMCSPETIGGIVKYIAREVNRSNLPYLFEDRITFSGVIEQFIYEDGNGLINEIKLYKDMYNTNVAALNYRYDDPAGMYDEQMQFPQAGFSTPDSPVVVVKLLDCYLYQCNEGTLIDDNALLRSLVKYRNAIALAYIRSQPDYENTEWR